MTGYNHTGPLKFYLYFHYQLILLYFVSYFLIDTYFFPMYMTWLIINCLLSLLTLYLLNCSSKVNEYNTLIYWLSVAQFGFDFAHLFTADIFHDIERPTSLFFGLATGLFSLVLCGLLCYVIVARNYIDISFYIKKIKLGILYICFKNFYIYLIHNKFFSLCSYFIFMYIYVHSCILFS